MSDKLMGALMVLVIAGIPVAIALVQTLLFRSNRKWIHLLLLISAGVYWLFIQVLLIVEFYSRKFYIFNTWLDAGLVHTEFVLFWIGEGIAWLLFFIRKKRCVHKK